VVKTELEQWRMMKRNVEEWTWIGKALNRCAAPGDTFVTAAIGAVGYYSGLNVFDQCGLVDLKVASRVMENPAPRSAGHDKYVAPEFFLERMPAFLRITLVPGEIRKKVEKEFEKTVPDGYEVVSLPLRALLKGKKKGDRFLVLQKRKQDS